MDRKQLIALNVVWAAAAAGAFLVGKSASPEPGTKGAAAPGGSGAAGYEGSGAPSALGSGKPGSGRPGGRGSAAGPAASGGTTPGQQLTAALKDYDPIRRKARIAELLTNMTLADVDEILTAFEDGPRDDESSRHFRDFMYAWGRIGGAEAVAYALDPESPRRGSYNSVSAVSGWATSDPAGAQDFVATVEDAGTRQWMHYGVMREMLRDDLDGAIAYSELNERSRARGQQMDRLASAIFEQRGVDGMREWVASIDHTREGNDLLSYKQYAVSITLDRLAADNPDSALQFIQDNAREPFLTSDGLERAARRAAGDIDEELEWLAGLPAEVEGRRHAIGERFEDYLRSDFEAAGEWLAAQPLGPSYDEAIQDYAFSAARDNREAALAWVERISDPEMKAETLRRITQGPQRGDFRGRGGQG